MIDFKPEAELAAAGAAANGVFLAVNTWRKWANPMRLALSLARDHSTMPPSAVKTIAAFSVQEGLFRSADFIVGSRGDVY